LTPACGAIRQRRDQAEVVAAPKLCNWREQLLLSERFNN
jgi:hypothetical protein